MRIEAFLELLLMLRLSKQGRTAGL